MTETRSKPIKSEPKARGVESIKPDAPEAEDVASVSASRPARMSKLRQTAQSLWQAGLGAALTIESRAGDAFRRLVKKGARYQSLRQRRRHRNEAAEIEASTEHARTLKASASERMHHIEHSIEASLDRGRDNTLHWIGVPSRKDFDALEKQVDALTHLVATMQGQLDNSAAKSMGSGRSRAQH